MPIGNNLKVIREERGLSQQDLAKLAHITSGYISKIETGKVNPSSDKLKKIVIALETTCDRLLFDETELEPAEEFKELFKKSSDLPESEKSAIKQLLRAFITQSVSDQLNSESHK